MPMGPAFGEPTPTSGFVDALSSPAVAPFSSQDFATAETCSGCHPQHYAEWRTTAHAHAMEDPVFQALIETQRRVIGTDLDRFCTQCHSAIGTRSLEITDGFVFDALSDVVREGVTCNSCHRITHVEREHNAGHVLDPLQPIQGRLGDSSAMHGASYNPGMASSVLCGSCHDVRVGQLVLESPYAEWQDSPAAARGQSCQGCHMPSYRGPAAALPDMPERDVHRHTFTGVEVPFGVEPGEERDALERASEALLQSAIALAIEPSIHLDAHDRMAVDVVVTNLVDGHNVPTGSSFFRQCWVALEVRDADGTLLLSSGELDEHGDLYDGFHPEREARDPDLQLLSATLLDATGTPVLFPFQAATRDDHGLTPLEARRLSYVVRVPAGTAFPLTISARVRFRSLSPRLLRAIDRADLSAELRIVDMARAETEITPR
jgi:hypothetical protein